MQLSNSKPVFEVVSEEHQQLQNAQSSGAGSEPKTTTEQLDTQLAEMKHAQHGLLQEPYRIKRERNALVPLHRLPGEIFVSILLRCARYVIPGSEQENKVLHSLAQVSIYWFDTILTFPSFWDLLALYHPPRFREWVLKRNTSGLFYIECVPSQEETGPVGEKLLSFMKMAAALAERWKQLTFDGEATDEIMELLQSPTPNLDSLLISSWGSPGAGSRMLELGEGRNIQYLDIDNITVPWSSTRLRGLRGVQIQHISGRLPSLAELHAMLAASPELWWLQLSSWSPSDDGTALASEVTSSHVRPIILPFLTNLILHQIPAEVTHFVLSSITAPTCQCVIAQEVPLPLLNNPASSGTFTGLINGALKAIPRFLLEYRTGSERLGMLSQPRTTVPYGWIDHVDERPGLNSTWLLLEPAQPP
ncbi:hypothetical protein M407DRAFT_22762 [Tulasnella calospora MUT 4182]|uniref:F-box domain-containing protein n=1 Tax=Tulasnella calospora MUT 4182 TaxID=1051891 RepID=A0A0C3L2M6_9AGAM|nr:hypothetical protein M407DRAFT_22762 [Tulasnella calospora MUT 4182]